MISRVSGEAHGLPVADPAEGLYAGVPKSEYQITVARSLAPDS